MPIYTHADTPYKTQFSEILLRETIILPTYAHRGSGLTCHKSGRYFRRVS